MNLHNLLGIRPIHPFPARMAPAIVWDELPTTTRRLRVLDPMAGSGTSLVIARAKGHSTIGFDSDPMAILLASTWCGDVSVPTILRAASKVQARALSNWSSIPLSDSYPRDADVETRAFAKYWFDATSRRQLRSLADEISSVRSEKTRRVLWCAFSRLIIAKSVGASRAMDVSHSRPHRVYTRAPIEPVERFLASVDYVLRAAPFKESAIRLPLSDIRKGDARCLPLEDKSVDVIVTSPPYSNAIDYMRAHRMSLVWMGHSLRSLRSIRSTNIGTEVSLADRDTQGWMPHVLGEMGVSDVLSPSTRGMLRRYITDIDASLHEMSRVLVQGGKAIIVIGDSTMRGVFVQNSKAIIALAARHGLELQKVRTHQIPDNKRYLPPPSSSGAGGQLRARMREEVVISLRK